MIRHLKRSEASRVIREKGKNVTIAGKQGINYSPLVLHQCRPLAAKKEETRGRGQSQLRWLKKTVSSYQRKNRSFESRERTSGN